MKRIVRVFPRKTSASPVDALTRFNEGPGWFDEADEVHVSVTFTWDLKRAEELVKMWAVAPVKIGGPATGEPEGEFTPGMYLKPGYVITSRGCPNHCPHCLVPIRNGLLRELPIQDGWILQDDNLLGCSEAHIRKVFQMLEKHGSEAELRGMEARLLEKWHVELMGRLRPGQVFFACDIPEAIHPLRRAMNLMRQYDEETGSGLSARWRMRCYVLIGYKDEPEAEARRRLEEVWDAGFMPFAMLYHDEAGNVNDGLRDLQREWSRPAIMNTVHRE